MKSIILNSIYSYTISHLSFVSVRYISISYLCIHVCSGASIHFHISDSLYLYKGRFRVDAEEHPSKIFTIMYASYGKLVEATAVIVI